MANEENLMPIQEVNSRRSREEHSEDSRMGGKKSGEVRRQRKAMREQMSLLLSLPYVGDEGNAFMKGLGLNDDEIDNQMALMVTIYKRAMEKGDIEAFREIKAIVEDKNSRPSEDRIQIVDDLDDETS